MSRVRDSSPNSRAGPCYYGSVFTVYRLRICGGCRDGLRSGPPRVQLTPGLYPLRQMTRSLRNPSTASASRPTDARTSSTCEPSAGPIHAVRPGVSLS